jgi:hypothetical protein
MVINIHDEYALFINECHGKIDGKTYMGKDHAANEPLLMFLSSVHTKQSSTLYYSRSKCELLHVAFLCAMWHVIIIHSAALHP